MTSGVRMAFGIVALLCVSHLIALAGAEAPPSTQASYHFSGPYTHGNLTVFLVHGQDQPDAKKYLTLTEALAQKKVIVHETGNVNELAIENTSDDDVYIQSGDIVKGGRQDRTIGQDFILTSRSGKVPINAFCVEHGRWSQRGTELAASFAVSDQMLAGRDLKMAAKSAGDQGQVWHQVAQAQQKLQVQLGTTVAAATSPSSLQLTLENPKVRENTDAYVNALSKVIDDKDDVIGYAFAINGKVNSMDVYASRDLFKKLWPKLLQSTAVEAVSEGKQDTKSPAVKQDDVAGYVAQADGAQAKENQLTPRVNLVTKDAANCVLFETQDRQNKSNWVHRNYITREQAPNSKVEKP